MKLIHPIISYAQLNKSPLSLILFIFIDFIITLGFLALFIWV